jgi:hypothetical protein
MEPATVKATKQRHQQKPKKSKPVATPTTKKAITPSTVVRAEPKRPAAQMKRSSDLVPVTAPKKTLSPAQESASLSKQTAQANAPTTVATTTVSTTAQQPTFMSVMAATQKATTPSATDKNKPVATQTPFVFNVATIVMAPSVVPPPVVEDPVVSTSKSVGILGKMRRKLANRFKALFARFTRQN